MTIIRLLTSFSLWLYISTTITQSVGSDLTFLYTGLSEQSITVTQFVYIQHYLQGGHPPPGQDDAAQLDLQTCREDLQGLTSQLELIETEKNKDNAQLDLRTCRENLQGLTSQLELIETENNNRDPVCAEPNVVSDVLTELQKVQEVLQEMQATDATINHTRTTHEAELDRYKDEVATLTGIIQDQQNVIEGLQNFSNTIPDEVATLTGIIQDQQSMIEGLQNFSNTLPDEVATLTGKIQNQESVIQGLQNFSSNLPDEFATLTGIIQDQQSVIEGLQNFSNTLPDEIDGRFNDQQNQTEWLKMKYDELENRSDCEHDGSVYKHGEDDGCYYKCYHGAMKMIFNQTTGNQCVGPFEIFEGNCYYFNHTRVTWCEARKACVALGGDLATDNFNALKDFFTANYQGWSPWIGVRDNLWLNGQPPQQQQWMSGEPSAQDQCGWMYTGGLGDDPCHDTRPSICQLY